jgi:hydrogenase maturation protease
MSVLVACVGNIFHGDDAFGCEVARQLAQSPQPSDVRVVDFGIRGLDLTYALLDAPDLTILVDTVYRGGEPGTLYTIEPDLTSTSINANARQSIDAHAMDPVKVLRTAQAMGARLKRVLLVACEPADLGGEFGRMGLTPPVSSAISHAAEMVQALIEKEHQQGKPNETQNRHI